MNYLGIEVPVANTPELDPGFIPLGKFFDAFLKDARRPLSLAVERAGGEVACTTPSYTALPTWPRPTVTTSTAW